MQMVDGGKHFGRFPATGIVPAPGSILLFLLFFLLFSSIFSPSLLPADPDNSGNGPARASAVDEVVRRNKEVIRLYNEGNFHEALSRCQETCELAKRDLGGEHPEFDSCISNLALIYEALGRVDQAEPLLKQSLEISRKVYGENSPGYTTGLNNLAGLYLATGRYPEAEKLYLQCAGIIRAAVGENNAYFVRALNNLASLYKAMGNYVEVEPLYRKAADILLKLGGEDQPDYAMVLTNLAQFYDIEGRYPEAESTYRKSLEIKERIFGKQHPSYGITLNNLGSVYENTGNYAEAEKLYRQALDIMTAKSGKGSAETGAVLNNLAGLYKKIGDYGKAEKLYRQVNDVQRAASGEKSPKYAVGLGGLADLYYQMGKFEEAEKLFLEVLQIQRAALGENNPDTALTMQNLAALYKVMGRYPEAEPLYRKALGIFEASLGSKHPDVALALHNLASLYQGMGKYEEAEPLYRKALEVRIAVLGSGHPDVADTQDSLASLFAATSRPGEALDLIRRAQKINDRLMMDVFRFANENQRMKYLDVIRGEMDACLSLISQSLSNSPEAVAAGFDMVLKRKAIVAEAWAAQRDAVLGGRYPELAPLFRKLTTLNTQIAQKTMSGPGPEGPEAHRQTIEKWETGKEELESSLAEKVPEIGLERRLAEANRLKVAEALPSGAALVEFVKFYPFDFRAVRARGERPWKPARYLAFVLVPGEPETVRMIDLGEAGPIDDMILDFSNTITGKIRKTPDAREGARDPAEAGPRLREALFDPIRKYLGDRKRVVVAPDGNIYNLAFGVLPEDRTRSLIDDYLISYVGVGRDILRFGAPAATAPSDPVVIAAPDYDLETAPGGPKTEPAAAEEKNRRGISQPHHFDRLPETGVEGDHIAKMLGVEPFEGASATKRLIEEAHSPRILHIATHGIFSPDRPRKAGSSDGWESAPAGSEASPRGSENPLLRSGLALAGANAEPGLGILTAEDASGLDLVSTNLVVLSACETGLGEIKTGEGVFGLRRAFLLAGARTLLMTLWKIPDEETRMLMESFYRHVLEGKPGAEALREAQLEVRAVSSRPFFWGAFICQGDPGSLGPAPVKRH